MSSPAACITTSTAGSCTSVPERRRGRATACGSIDREPIARGDLDQAEDRLERVLRDELGVEPEPARGAEVADQLVELGGRGDQAFRRGSAT